MAPAVSHSASSSPGASRGLIRNNPIVEISGPIRLRRMQLISEPGSKHQSHVYDVHHVQPAQFQALEGEETVMPWALLQGNVFSGLICFLETFSFPHCAPISTDEPLRNLYWAWHQHHPKVSNPFRAREVIVGGKENCSCCIIEHTCEDYLELLGFLPLLSPPLDAHTDSYHRNKLVSKFTSWLVNCSHLAAPTSLRVKGSSKWRYPMVQVILSRTFLLLTPFP